MIRSVFMIAMAFALMSGESFAGGGGKSNGTLVVRNATAEPTTSVAIVVDPPASWASWVVPLTVAQKAELTKRATIVGAGASQTFSVKNGTHKVLAVNTITENHTLTTVLIVKKRTTTIMVTP